ncbi:Ribonuclease h protein [Thalictrum thalictroides]|uniref:Ribonuclease h protein n=1 Tax=Thalictrum thalictroides TaxID=46969 RepID=A0A7J6W240_THATH|nr:Ribonuclease h protein [Thalictrum thalictroides]
MKMLMGVKSFLQPCNLISYTPLSHYIITPTYLISNKTHKTNSNASSNFLFLQGRNGVFVSAVKKQKKSSKSLIEMDDFDEFDDEEEEDEEGAFIPLSGMKEWLEKKPRGFGEGKEYDTSLEEKLLEELEQSRKAQIMNINNLKKNPLLSSSKKEKEVIKAPEAVPTGIRVRVGNLPKKKNIRRDLQLVFKGFPAILNISPANSGNKKTRDPICKGFAFVDLGSMEAANRFVQMYSKKSITFGKIQKEITCEITTNPASNVNHNYTSTFGQRLPRISSEDSDVEDFSLEATKIKSSAESGLQKQQVISKNSETIEEDIAPLNLSDTDDFQDNIPTAADITDFPHLENSVIPDSYVDDFSMEPVKIRPPDESDVQQQHLIPESLEAIEEGSARINLTETDDFQKRRPATADITDSPPPKKQQKKQSPKKKQAVKGKSDKFPKSNIPGSAKRLRVKEKSVLSDVFSKFRVHYYSTTAAPGTVAGRKRSKKKKLDPELSTAMEEEKDAFYVVRKGDIVGVYKSLSDCQDQVGTSVCDPSVSVFKGYSLSKEAEEYLTSRGLKNAIYAINAADAGKEDLFGTLVPCPFQQPTSVKDITSKPSPPKRSQEVLESASNLVKMDEHEQNDSISTDHFVGADTFGIMGTGELTATPLKRYVTFLGNRKDGSASAIGEMYQRMIGMVENIKQTLAEKLEIREIIENLITIRWETLNHPLHCLAYVLTPYYYSGTWLRGGKRRKPHADRYVDKVYLDVVEQMVRDPMEREAFVSSSTDHSRKHTKFENFVKGQANYRKCISCTLEFDGASKGNPGPSGAGAVLRADDESVVWRLREGVGIATNNVAEYRAVLLGLKQALKKGFSQIRVRGDSKLVCMQVQGLWKIKNENMATLCKEVKALKDQFLSFQISHVLRDFNSEADAQANLAVDLADGEVAESCD